MCINRHLIDKTEADIYIPEINLAVEYDGYYHNKQKSITRDAKKNKLFNNKGIHLVRIRYSNAPVLSSYGSYTIIDYYNGTRDYVAIKSILSDLRVFIKNNFNLLPEQAKHLEEWESISIEEDELVILNQIQQLLYEESLAFTRPDLIKEWHPNKNINLTPNSILAGSQRKVWWKCLTCNHEWRANVKNRSKGVGCPACENKVVTSTNSLLACNPNLAKEWHPTKNGELSPGDVTPGSELVAWWRCSTCGYEWQRRVASRNAGRGCAFCAKQVVTDKNCLSELRPDLLEEWHPTKNVELSPDSLGVKSNQRVWWKCLTCEFEWQASPNNRSKGHKCPACANRVVTIHNCLATQNEKVALDWHYSKNGALTPKDVVPGSGKQVWWLCSTCGFVWRTRIVNRTLGTGCPSCCKDSLNK
ncbi:hypothetical protein AXX12_18500 [Anaerosporomusa subterranea]|uniref:Treble clef zinc finger domain-containing protein n=2 Tax=Anaerosporomusa subterranea TaxID=1794912 RepID=A0A154BSA7_ANASB|nr:hypothetical protein AXX12_18500 [Anaerosporomusa subterranea]